MGSIAFPSRLKPIINRGYGFSRGSNVKSTDVQGGLARIALNYSLEAVPFNINLIASTQGAQAFWDFYDAALDHGANTFPMELDSGNGVETHQCMITPGSLNSSTIDQQTWAISMEIMAESNPSQDQPFVGGLYPLWDLYGDGLKGILDQYAILALEDLST
jgi:hypothetical protein